MTKLLRKCHFQAPEALARDSCLVLKESKLCQQRSRLMSDLASTASTISHCNLNFSLPGTAGSETILKETHPVTLITDRFGQLLHSTYGERLAELTEAISTRNIFRSKAVRELQLVGKCLLQDVQEFLVVAKDLLVASYSGSCDTAEQTFLDAASEVLGNLLFTRNEGVVFRLVHALFESQLGKEIARL